MPDYSLNWARSPVLYNAINIARPPEGGLAKVRGFSASSLLLIIDTPSICLFVCLFYGMSSSSII